jgi:GPH family glycoside/pentoside/hexuronide:cation symporter/probable glucitol transport protein GutA
MPPLQQDFVLSPKERYSFGFALFGQNLIYGLFLNYLMIFYTDVYGISAAAVGTLFLVARTWDALNDPVMGMIVDRTQTRWGKFRPWLLWTPLPIAITTVACFFTPDVSAATRLALAYLTYIVWGMVYTVNDVPLWALSSAMSQNSQERTGLISLARILATVGIMVPAILVIPMVDFFGKGDDAAGYFYTACCLSAVAALLMVLAFFNTRERVIADASKPTLRDSANALLKNRPLLMIILMSFMGIFAMAAQSLFIYYVTYNLGDRGLMPTLMLVTVAALICGMVPIPWLVRRLGKKGTFAFITIARALVSVIYYLIGWENQTLVYLMTFCNGLFLGSVGILTTAMIADSIEYMQWKTGKRSEGIIFSTQTFLAKITTAIGGFAGGMALTLINYVPNAEQSPEALTGIFWLITLLPGIGGLLALIPLYFYELNEIRHGEILAELESRAQATPPAPAS